MSCWRRKLISSKSTTRSLRHASGARYHFNQIREGSEASDESVLDLATGKPLKFEVVTGAQAKIDSPAENFSAAAKYIKVFLAHPIAERGEYRLAIIQDLQGRQELLHRRRPGGFQTPSGIPRDSVVLPAGYEIVPVR
jgi:hypothetical protein